MTIPWYPGFQEPLQISKPIDAQVSYIKWPGTMNIMGCICGLHLWDLINHRCGTWKPGGMSVLPYIYMYYTLQPKKCITFIVSLQIYFSLKKLNHLLLFYRWEKWGTQRPKLPLSIMSSFVSALNNSCFQGLAWRELPSQDIPKFPWIVVQGTAVKLVILMVTLSFNWRELESL